jgi:hypothetical protein
LRESGGRQQQRRRAGEQQGCDDSLHEAHSISPAVATFHVSVGFGARGEVLIEQAKCHAIPDFLEKQTQRFL